jgi:DNA-binding transcriptional LysR family regulator
MKLRQLELLLAVVRHDMSISGAAAALNTSQPSVSRQILQLEAELGAPLFARRKNRIVGLTRVGEAAFEAARRMQNQVNNIDLIACEARDPNEGAFTLATSHLHARYTMLRPMVELQKKYPGVHVTLFQADPDKIPDLVRDGDADIGLSTSDPQGGALPGLVVLRGEVLRRAAIFAKGHPLAKKRDITLRDLCDYDVIGYNDRSRTGRIIHAAFESAGLHPRTTVRANDSDVIKAYVAAGLGVGIVPEITLSERDPLNCRDITQLLPRTHLCVILRDDMHLRQSLISLLSTLSPQWTGAALRREMRKTQAGA